MQISRNFSFIPMGAELYLLALLWKLKQTMEIENYFYEILDCFVH